MDLIRRVLDEDPIDADRERALARAARSGDIDARDALLRAGLRLVALRVLALGFGPAERDDAFQVGVLALVDAVDRFDPDRGVRLATYAWPWLTHALRRHRRRPPEVLTDRLPERSVAATPAVDQDESGVWSAVEGLAAEERDAVVARFGPDSAGTCPRPWDEVAAHLGVSSATARRRVDRALSRLRRGVGTVSSRAPLAGADPP